MMKKLILILFCLLILNENYNPAICGVVSSKNTLLWSEEFDQIDTKPDINTWSMDIGNGQEVGLPGWGCSQNQYYTYTNARIQNGFLTIRSLKENKNGFNYTSSKLVSKRLFTHSIIEIRAKLAEGQSKWSAFWLQGVDGSWPTSGDLDIMEYVGNIPNTVHASCINEEFNNMKGNKLNASGSLYSDDLFENFHVYKMDWNSKRIIFSVNEKVYFVYVNDNMNNIKTWPYNGRFKLNLNLAIGGNGGFGDIIDSGDNMFPSDLIIDYIRQYSPN